MLRRRISDTNKSVQVFSCCVAVAVVASGCVRLSNWFKGSKDSSSDPGSVKPTVSNAVAYARYAALNLRNFPNQDLGADEIRAGLLDASVQSKISAADILAFYSASPNPADGAFAGVNQPSNESPSGAQTPLSADAPPGESAGATLAHANLFKAQLDLCSARGNAREECCRALVWPMSVLPQWSSLPAQTQEALLGQAQSVGANKPFLKHGQVLKEQTQARSTGSSA